MIFLTVGTQISFNRMTNTVDEWAGKNPEEKIYAQIGNTHLQPKYLIAKKYYTPEEFDKIFEQADLIISHAGTGTIIKALLAHKSIIVFPRRASLGEHRNDHQMATVKSLKKKFNLNVAYTEEELTNLLKNMEKLQTDSINISRYADKELLESIRQFILE